MSALKRIFGLDTKFYDLLESAAEAAQQSSAILTTLVGQLGTGAHEQTLSELAQARRKHKRVNQQTTEELCKNFVTPLEREDIEALSLALFKITKNVEKIGERLLIAPPGTNVSAVRRQVGMLEQAAEIVRRMVSKLRTKSHGENVQNENEHLQAIEGDADKLMNDLLRDLYQTDAEARSVVFWKDLYELLEKGIDRCRDAGHIVFQVVLKYS